MPPKPRLKENRPLPLRWRWRKGAFQYRVPPGQEHHWDGRKEFRLGATLQEAYKTWAERMGEINTDPNAALDKIMDRYLREVVPEKAPKTQDSNQRSIARLRPVFGHVMPTAVKPAHVYRYFDLTKKAHGQTTAKHDVQVLRHVLTQCVMWGLIDKNPLIGQIRLKGTTAPSRRLVEDWEIAEAFTLGDREKLGRKPSRGVETCLLYIAFKYATGQRRGDILRLTLADLKDDGIHFLPNKTRQTTGKGVIIKWDEDLEALVRKIKEMPPRRVGNAPLFVTRQGKPYIDGNGSANGFDSVWQRFMDKVLAHTKVSERFEERALRAKSATDSGSLEEASERLAHGSTETTKRIYRRKPAVVPALILKVLKDQK